MKNPILIFALLFSPGLFAYSCPPALSESQSKLQAWLEPWRGLHEMDGCRVELTVCAPDGREDMGSVLAEVYIVDQRGREAYLPLILTSSEKIHARASYYPRTFHYLKRDKYKEDEFGRTETSRFEITLTHDHTGIESMDLGLYATNKPLQWFNCRRKSSP